MKIKLIPIEDFHLPDKYIIVPESLVKSLYEAGTRILYPITAKRRGDEYYTIDGIVHIAATNIAIHERMQDGLPIDNLLNVPTFVN